MTMIAKPFDGDYLASASANNATLVAHFKLFVAVDFI